MPLRNRRIRDGRGRFLRSPSIPTSAALAISSRRNSGLGSFPAVLIPNYVAPKCDECMEDVEYPPYVVYQGPKAACQKCVNALNACFFCFDLYRQCVLAWSQAEKVMLEDYRRLYPQSTYNLHRCRYCLEFYTFIGEGHLCCRCFTYYNPLRGYGVRCIGCHEYFRCVSPGVGVLGNLCLSCISLSTYQTLTPCSERIPWLRSSMFVY